MTRPHFRNYNAPLTSEKVLKDTRARQNALNKNRAHAMEVRIAKMLRGRRVPMSGAAKQYKGDCEIPFINNAGSYLIECKLSADLTSDANSRIRLQYSWLTKLQGEVQAMKSKFGILVVHYLNTKGDYVFIRVADAMLLIQRYTCRFSEELLYLLRESPCIIPTKQTGSLYIEKSKIDEKMLTYQHIRGIRYIFPDSEYLVMSLSDFRSIVENI